MASLDLTVGATGGGAAVLGRWGQIEAFQAVRLFAPTERQLELYRAVCGTPEPGLALVGYGGAMGGGKTRALVELAIDAALLFPGTNILIGREHYTDLASTTMAEFDRYCPTDVLVARRQSPMHSASLRMPSWPAQVVSTVNFRHLSDWTGIGSQQYGAVLIDEAGQVDEEAARMLLTRLRHPAQPQRWFVAASNPWPGWFERWFVRRELPEAQLAQASGKIVYVPARVEDNPHLPASYADLQRALLPADWVDRFIEGRFDAFQGGVYPDFDPVRHRWDAPLPQFARLIGGLDFGSQTERSHYTAGIVAGITGRGAPCGANVLIRLAEFEDRGPGVFQRLEQWMDASRRKFGRIVWCADRSQMAWIDQQRRVGRRVRPSRGGSGSVQWGIGLVAQRLAGDAPTSYYAPTLTQFPLRMREYQWERPDDAQPQPKKHNDDLLDADRYCHELAVRQPVKWSQVEIVTPERGRPAPWRVGESWQ